MLNCSLPKEYYRIARCWSTKTKGKTTMNIALKQLSVDMGKPEYDMLQGEKWNTTTYRKRWPFTISPRRK